VQAHEIVVLMAGAAFDGVDAVPVRAAVNPHCVAVAVVSLAREIARGVAIDTARVTEHWDEGFKGSGGGGIIMRCNLCRSRHDGQGKQCTEQSDRYENCAEDHARRVHARAPPRLA